MRALLRLTLFPGYFTALNNLARGRVESKASHQFCTTRHVVPQTNKVTHARLVKPCLLLVPGLSWEASSPVPSW